VGELKRVSTEAVGERRLREVAKVRLPDVATWSMLDGLATLHPIVLAVDDALTVMWLHDDLDIIEGGASKAIGNSVSSLLDGLWPDDIATFGEQTRMFFVEMVENDRATRARFDLRRDGQPLSLDVSAFHVRDASGQDLIICVADRHRALETLETLEQKNEELECYVQNVSHDLRSPLVSLLGFSRLLRDDYDQVLDETGLHFLDRIEQAGRNMEQLLDDMLQLLRIQETSHWRVDVNPMPILEQLQAELKLQLDEKNIHLSLPENPPCVLCDRTRLYQLLSNLIGNAIHHMQHDMQHDMQRRSGGRIDVAIETVSDGWQITVADDGPGIAAEDHERIFEAFQTVRRPSDGRPSSGLGLAIVKKIVDAHSGRIWLESQPDRGARFHVWLPKG
jgi:signal transduction histidine kinase